MSTSKKFYALSDTFSGDYPIESTEGFANTKEVIFFLSSKARDEWLKETKLTTARALTRAEAIRYSTKEYNGERTVRPAQNVLEECSDYYAVIRYSRSRY